MKIVQKLLMVGCATVALGLYADNIKVYNGSIEPVAVAIVQGVFNKADGLFYVHPKTVKVKGLNPGQVLLTTIDPKSLALIGRPERTLGKDTVLLVFPKMETLQTMLQEGAPFAPEFVYTVGQMGNKELFLAPQAPGAAFGGRSKAIKAFPHIALYKSLKDMQEVAQVANWGTSYYGHPIALGGVDTGTAVQQAKKALGNWSEQAQSTLSQALTDTNRWMSQSWRTAGEAAQVAKLRLKDHINAFVAYVNQSLDNNDQISLDEALQLKVNGQPPRTRQESALAKRAQKFFRDLKEEIHEKSFDAKAAINEAISRMKQSASFKKDNFDEWVRDFKTAMGQKWRKFKVVRKDPAQKLLTVRYKNETLTVNLDPNAPQVVQASSGAFLQGSDENPFAGPSTAGMQTGREIEAELRGGPEDL